MSLISQSIKNLKGGISQQPDILRFPDQGAAQVNGWSSETEGLQKRPPLVFVKQLGGKNYLGADPLVHYINRSDDEKYLVAFSGTGVKVFDLNGKEYSVDNNTASYIRTSNPKDDLRMVTVADYTFIVNRNIAVQNRGDRATGGKFNPKNDCLIAVRGSQYGRTIKVTINGVDRANFTLHDGAEAWQGRTISTDKVIRYIVDQMTTGKTTEGQGNLPGLGHYGVFDYVTTTPLPSGWTVQAMDGFVYVKAPAGQSIDSITTSDGYSDQLVYPVTHYVQTTAKLPLNAPDGYYVKVVGEAEGTADQYYLRFDKDARVWREAIGWNALLGFNRATMPHALIRKSDGNFEVKQLDWADKEAGDDDTNPDVSLVGSRISDVFFFRNRLGFVSGENIVMSRTGRYFKLYPASVAAISDDDPIDIAVSYNRVVDLQFAVPFTEELLLWANGAQFILSASGILSSKTVELNLATQFSVHTGARPFGIGRNVYYASPRATFTSINRYFTVQDVSAVKDSQNMTAHTPNYIPNGVFNIGGSSTENYLSVITSGAPSRVYLFKFMYDNGDPIQQSWSHWDFGENAIVRAFTVDDSCVNLVLENGISTFMAKVEFTRHTIDLPDEPYRAYFDMKKRYVIPAGTYNIDTNLTTINLKTIYQADFNQGEVAVLEVDGKITLHQPLGDNWSQNGNIELNGNMEGQTIFLGFTYKFVYEFSKFLIKKDASDGSTATEDIGRLQLRRAWVNYENSGAFVINVDNGSQMYSYEMAGSRLGTPNLRIGRLNVGTGQFKFPIAGNSLNQTVTIISDNTTPLNIIGCGWEGNYIRRSSGM
ncbi:tail protein [Morganella phage vB_MmoP_MP2]|uniref:Tail tubular protein B n=1 Tax=Morganella phage vB_MmoP_MP2 TaxID=1852627 RepID=A0A192Y9U8_9CAUD|nr:tail protein [Morganella phage vB_MmoP_MP2]ANM46342.1 tail tubular protein B [Morganella phage vB_MmoP_MP2]